MSQRRVKMLAMVLPIAVAAIALLAWSQTWIEVTLDDDRVLAVGGGVAAPAIPPLAIAGLALVGALALAGIVFRVILGLMQAVLGVGIVASAAVALADPVLAASSSITEATGIEGSSSVREIVTQSVSTAWPVVALAVGLAAIVVGIGISATAHHWPGRVRKYDALRTVDTAPQAPGDGRHDVDAWDALSDGDDPTAR